MAVFVALHAQFCVPLAAAGPTAGPTGGYESGFVCYATKAALTSKARPKFFVSRPGEDDQDELSMVEVASKEAKSRSVVVRGGPSGGPSMWRTYDSLGEWLDIVKEKGLTDKLR